MNNKSRDFLYQYINNAAPSGHETSGQKIWLSYIKAYTDTYFTDVYGSVAAVINPDAPYKVVLEAHADQVSYYVNFISPDGYIYVAKNGGSEPVIAPSKKVIIHTDNGEVYGIFGWPAPHVKNSDTASPTIESIYIDTGCDSRQEVMDLGIEVGNVVTFQETLCMLNNKLYSGPALDNRIGGFIIAEVARLLREQKKELIPYGLYLVNSVQEEVGKNGALLMANNIMPDVAIVTDVTHDTRSPMYNKKVMGEITCGKGPVLTSSPSVHNNVLKMMIDTAKKHQIPYQKKAASKSTGTDTDVFAFSDSGVASALVSLPLKYMHTTVESVHHQDVEHAIQLLYHFLINLQPGHDFSYLK